MAKLEEEFTGGTSTNQVNLHQFGILLHFKEILIGGENTYSENSKSACPFPISRRHCNNQQLPSKEANHCGWVINETVYYVEY